MSSIIDAIYEDGVLKPLSDSDLKEHQKYRLILREINTSGDTLPAAFDPELAAEIERRTKILPDGRKIIRLSGLFQADLSNAADNYDPITELRFERSRKFDEEWPEIDDKGD